MRKGKENKKDEKEKKKGKKRGGWLVLVVVVLLGGAAMASYFWPESEVIPIEEVAEAELPETALKEIYQPKREYGYGTFEGKRFDLNGLFVKLPPLPEDFFHYRRAMLTGQISAESLCELGPEYYAQPEFIGNLFEGKGIEFYRNPDPARWTPEGYGTFPHEMETITFPGATFDVCTFFHSSWRVSTYQGFSLYPVHPGSVTYQGRPVSVNTTASEQYLTVDVTPGSVLLEPSYLLFEPGWVKKVKLTITVSEDAPVGTYSVGFDIGRAPLEDAREWQRQYKDQYIGKSGIGVGKSQFVMVVVVE